MSFKHCNAACCLLEADHRTPRSNLQRSCRFLIIYYSYYREFIFFCVISLYMQPRDTSLSTACMHAVTVVDPYTQPEWKTLSHTSSTCGAQICSYSDRCPLWHLKHLFIIQDVEVCFSEIHTVLISYHMYANKNHYSVILLLYFWSSLPHLHIHCALKQLLGIWQTLSVTPSTLWLFCRMCTLGCPSMSEAV